MKRAKPNAPIWIKLFVAFHLVAITSWSLPSAPNVVKSGKAPAFGNDHLLLFNENVVRNFPPLRVYLLCSGFWQYWDMFSPDPSDQDLWGEVIVTRQNGLVEKYAYPRMYTMPIYEKYFKERYRKFFERASDSKYSYLWAQFAYHVALLVDTDPENRPMVVALVKHTQVVPKLGEPMPTTYSDETFFMQTIDFTALDKVKQP